MKKLSQLVPEGVTDLLVNDFEFKEQILLKLKKLFKIYGYKQIQTPIFEYYDLFSEMKNTIERDRMIKLMDTNGKILVLRPDATIPIARMVATNYRETDVQKFSYVTSIFRMTDKGQNVQSREFTQAGVEWFGPNGENTDADIVALAIETLRKAGAQKFTIDIGKANFFKALMNEINITSHELTYIQKFIENKNFAQLEHAIKELSVDDALKNALRAIPSLCGDPERVLQQAQQIAVNEEMKTEVAQLKSVYEILVSEGFKDYLSFDLGLINNLNYYTGIVFQGYIAGFGKPVLQGGRYDKLTSQFGLDMKATGFAVYVDDLIEALSNK